MKQKLSVIVPVFNEERAVAILLKKVLAQKEVTEVIVIDDGSTDKSLEKISQIKSKHLKIYQHAKNMGKGQAIKTGLKYAKGDLILIQDADLEYNPKDYSHLLKPLLKKEAEFIIGNRKLNHKKGYLLARLGNFYLTRLINLLFDSQIADPYCCYKLGPKALWRKLKLKSNGFEIEAEIICKLLIFKKSIKEVKISYQPRKYSQGKKIHLKDVFWGTKTIFNLSQTKA